MKKIFRELYSYISPELIENKRNWVIKQFGLSFNLFDMVSIDEARFNNQIIRTQGREKKYEKSKKTRETQKRSNFTLFLAVSKDHIKHQKTTILYTTANNFFEFIKELITKLQPRLTLIIDNASFYKSNELKRFIETYSHKIIFIPPYSPFLNPVELCFSNLKAFVRKQNILRHGDLPSYIKFIIDQLESKQKLLGYFQKTQVNYEKSSKGEVLDRFY